MTGSARGTAGWRARRRRGTTATAPDTGTASRAPCAASRFHCRAPLRLVSRSWVVRPAGGYQRPMIAGPTGAPLRTRRGLLERPLDQDAGQVLAVGLAGVDVGPGRGTLGRQRGS